MFLVFRCSKCGHFLYAPMKQKTRHCPYCAKVVKIDPNAAHIIKTDEEAREAVKQYNMGENLKAFLKGRKQDKEKITKVLNEELLEMKKKEEKNKKKRKEFKDKKLLKKILEKQALDPISLSLLESIAWDNYLSWDWVLSEIEDLVNKKQVIMKRPWEIQYLFSKEYNEPRNRTRDTEHISKSEIRRIVISLLKEKKQKKSINELIKIMDLEQISKKDIEDVINLLLNQGLIFEPESGYFKWVFSS
ncbi:MAG: DUF1922 domain-containing protein [Candidatus Ranarchaeia archaeon]